MVVLLPRFRTIVLLLLIMVVLLRLRITSLLLPRPVFLTTLLFPRLVFLTTLVLVLLRVIDRLPRFVLMAVVLVLFLVTERFPRLLFTALVVVLFWMTVLPPLGKVETVLLRRVGAAFGLLPLDGRVTDLLTGLLLTAALPVRARFMDLLPRGAVALGAEVGLEILVLPLLRCCAEASAIGIIIRPMATIAATMGVEFRNLL